MFENAVQILFVITLYKVGAQLLRDKGRVRSSILKPKYDFVFKRGSQMRIFPVASNWKINSALLNA
jgi:hypothetical protein